MNDDEKTPRGPRPGEQLRLAIDPPTHAKDTNQMWLLLGPRLDREAVTAYHLAASRMPSAVPWRADYRHEPVRSSREATGGPGAEAPWPRPLMGAVKRREFAVHERLGDDAVRAVAVVGVVLRNVARFVGHGDEDAEAWLGDAADLHRVLESIGGRGAVALSACVMSARLEKRALGMRRDTPRLRACFYAIRAVREASVMAAQPINFDRAHPECAVVHNDAARVRLMNACASALWTMGPGGAGSGGAVHDAVRALWDADWHVAIREDVTQVATNPRCAHARAGHPDHQCHSGCDECNEEDCRRRVAGRMPACDCRCHVDCFVAHYPDAPRRAPTSAVQVARAVALTRAVIDAVANAPRGTRDPAAVALNASSWGCLAKAAACVGEEWASDASLATASAFASLGRLVATTDGSSPQVVAARLAAAAAGEVSTLVQMASCGAAEAQHLDAIFEACAAALFAARDEVGSLPYARNLVDAFWRADGPALERQALKAIGAGPWLAEGAGGGA